MTVQALKSPISFPWFRRKAVQIAPPVVERTDGDDLRREYLLNMISSGACTGEYGAMALMNVFPRDF